MNSYLQAMRHVPFLTHYNKNELAGVLRLSEIMPLRRGEKISIKGSKSFFIILEGLFEYEGIPGKKEQLFLPQGAYIGEIPFIEESPRGTIRALTDATLLKLTIDSLYRSFLSSYKGMRGYIKTIQHEALQVTPSGKNYFRNNTKMISVCGDQQKTGKTLISSSIALGLSRKGKTILLDLSYSGKSLFDIFDKKLTPPISHKLPIEETSQRFLDERIQVIDDQLSILNVSFGTKVKMNPEIIAPMLFLLSKDYKYIVFDVGSTDSELNRKVYQSSDYIFPVLKTPADMLEMYPLLDHVLTEGQKVRYIINRYYSRKTKQVSGASLFDKISLVNSESIYSQLMGYVTGGEIDSLLEHITSRKKGLVLQPLGFDSLSYMGLLSWLLKSGHSFDCIYSSFVAYILSSLYLITNDAAMFHKYCSKLLKEERLNVLLDVAFPDEYIFKNNKILKYMQEMAKSIRIEHYTTLIMSNVVDTEMQQRTFSTGFLKEIMAASFALYPLFDPITIGAQSYHSGFPLYRAQAVDMLRSDMDDILVCSVQQKDKARILPQNFISIYCKYIDYFTAQYEGNLDPVGAMQNIMIDVDFDSYNITTILQDSEKLWQEAFKKADIL